MRKLYYKFNNSELDSYHEDYLHLYMEKSNLGKSSCWFSGIPAFLGKYSPKQIIKQKLRRSIEPHQQTDDLHPEPTTTIKTCPGIRSILKKSILLKAPCDIYITAKNDGNFSWYITPQMINDCMSIDWHSMQQLDSKNINLFSNKFSIKFQFPIQITSKNNPYIFLQPSYHNNVPFTVVNGVIDDDHTYGQLLNINVLFDIPVNEEYVDYVIPAGTVLCYLWFPEEVEFEHSKKIIPNYFRTSIGRFFYPKS
jgi:hypothetical protein